MFKKCFFFLIISIFSIILALYNKVKYENVGVNYYSSENNNGGSSSERSRNHGSDSSKGSYNGCELSDDYCSVDYIGDIKETQGSKIVSYKDTRINKVKKTFSQMFHPIFSEMNYESTGKNVISLFLEFFDNAKMFTVVSMRSSYHMLHAYGIVLISLLKILFLWFIIIEPYMQWLFFELKKFYIDLDYKTKKYIFSTICFFIAFLYFVYTGIINYILNKITKFYKYLLKKVFGINNFLFNVFPYIISCLLYATLVKTVPIYFISFFIYSCFFPLPSIYSVVIIIKYIYLPTINDCVINALTQTLKCKNDETNEQYSILNDNEFVELIHSDEDSYNRHSEKKKKNLEATRKEKEDKQETVCKSDKREKIAGRVALEEEVKDEGKNKVKDEVKHEVKNEVKHEVKNEVKHEVKHEVKREVGGEVMDEVVDKVKEKVMDKVEDKIEDLLYDEKTDDVQEAEEIKETKYTNDEHETSEVTGKKVSNMDKRKNNKNDEDEISSRVKSSKKKKLFSFKLDNFKFIPKKKKKEKMKIERSMEIECIDNKENNYESLELSKTDNENNVICYDVSILLEYWLFINILKFLSLFFFFRKYNKGSFMFEYFTLFVICINISEKLHEFMFLKNYKSSILVRFLKKFLVSTVDFLLYSLFNIRLESEDKKGKNGTDPNLKYAERSNILIKLSKIVKEKLKLNETVKFSLTCLKSVITENVVESVKLPIYIKIFINILIYMPQLILLIFPSFILKIYFAYFFFIFPIFGSLKSLEEKNSAHNKIYYICYFFFYNIASVTVNHAFFKCLPFYNLYKILITILVQTILKYIFNALKGRK
ncbi:conserved Plasmodium protein, unknown function [Plasmodium malariae]|uniref:Uncharacterized protein n=1 Tax=Plasmodium malariae TaxID=5858 RepID=A0A1C3L2Q2_PLAMA|nr:conserved Plasmodium protein, unknown function [Plasmodium malariae]